MLLHDFGRVRLQDRVGVIADQVREVGHAIGQARPVPHRAGTGCRRLEAGEEGWAQMPEKSGMDAAACVPLLAGPIAGAGLSEGRRHSRQDDQQNEITPSRRHDLPLFVFGFGHVLFRKPVPTFPEHALEIRLVGVRLWHRVVVEIIGIVLGADALGQRARLPAPESLDGRPGRGEGARVMDREEVSITLPPSMSLKRSTTCSLSVWGVR